MKAPTMTGSTRTIWIMAVTAVISLGAGLGLSRLIISPADAAANAAPPAAGPITVPVEQRQLANDVVLRGDAVYEDPASVVLETGDIGGPAVVTGHVPEVGATLNAGDVMLEVAGRPVILLAGDLPVYRTLRPGVSGPDVLQLKAALAALGINPGDQASAAYDATTASAVEQLYARVGYPAPTAGEEAEGALTAAREGVRGAEDSLAEAKRTLAAAEPSAVDRAERQARVNDAQAELVSARAACTAAATPEEAMTPEECAVGVTRAQGALDVAIIARDQPLDTTAQRAAVSIAERALTDAKTELAKAQAAVLTPLPSSEVVYLASAPRRVDSVEVHRGSTVAGSPVMSVSGATLQIAGTVAPADAELIAEGSKVVIVLPDGAEVPGTVFSVGVDAPATPGGQGGDGSGDGSGAGSTRERVVVVPDTLTEEQRAGLQGANVRMTIPVSSTEGEVLAVPTAALTAGPGGEARVEVLGDDGESVLVTVETGLAADGFVEVTPLDGDLTAGDRVVIGVNAGADEDAESTDEETTDEKTTDEETTKESESTDEESGDA
jgi:hypothetical protein